MSVYIEEQETHISIMRKGDRAEIYTSSLPNIKRFQEYAAENPEWKLLEIAKSNGETVGVRYSIPKAYITIRKKGNTMSDEAKEKARERIIGLSKKADATSSGSGSAEGSASSSGTEPKRGEGLPTDYGKGGRSKPPKPKKLEFYDKSLER